MSRRDEYFVARDTPYRRSSNSQKYLANMEVRVAVIGIFLYEAVGADTTIQFIGNSEANDGITYWAPNVPTITVVVTSSCSTNGTRLFTVSGDTNILYDSVLTLGENCASCECTTIESTVAISRECVAGNDQVSLSTRLSGISGETKVLSVRYNNGTNVFVKESQYRNCTKADVLQNFIISTQTSRESFGYMEGVDVTCSSCSNENSTTRAACEVNGQWNTTAVDCDTICAENNEAQTTTPFNGSTADGVTTLAGAANVTTTTTTATNFTDEEINQIIAVTVATNVIMVVSCCVMVFFFRLKRSDKEKSRNHTPEPEDKGVVELNS